MPELKTLGIKILSQKRYDIDGHAKHCAFFSIYYLAVSPCKISFNLILICTLAANKREERGRKRGRGEGGFYPVQEINAGP